MKFNLLAIFFVLACKTTPTFQSKMQEVGSNDFPDCQSGECLYEINNLVEFNSISGLVDTGVGEAKIVKIIYKRNPNTKRGRLYFINTRKYQYHFDFARHSLGVTMNHYNFNQQYELPGGERQFNMFSLIIHQRESAGSTELIPVVELWSGDTLEADFLLEFFTLLNQQLHLGSTTFKFHPLSAGQTSEGEILSDKGIPVISTQELWAGQEYIPLNRGEAVGKVVFIREGDEATCYDQTNIVVFEKVPNELDLVSGVVTSDFQTPLSHVNVKSINRGTVNMVLKDAFSKLAEYEGEFVRLLATKNGPVFTVIANHSEAQGMIREFWDAKRPVNALVPQIRDYNDYEQKFYRFGSIFSGAKSIQDLRELHGEFSTMIGAKATNLAMIYRFVRDFNSKNGAEFLDFNSPDGFGIPFSYFDSFMNYQQTGIDPDFPSNLTTPSQVIEKILDDNDMLNPDVFHSTCAVRSHLQKIRDVIAKSQIPESLYAEFKRVLIDDASSPVHQSKVGRIRLRSSTNAEDLAEFSGAGLYNSYGVSLYGRNDDGKFDLDNPRSWARIKETLAERLPLVYSSVWNDRAYSEREWYKINGLNHLKVKVGVAVHRSFSKYMLNGEPGEQANGVAVGTNIYKKPELPELYINSQHYDLAVTNPPTAKELEEWGEDPNKDYTTEESLITAFLAGSDNNSPDAWKSWSYQTLGKSSIKGGAQVLIDNPSIKNNASQMEVRRVAKLVDLMNKSFAPIYPNKPFIVDMEWKIMGARRSIWLKQARPFAISNSKEKEEDLNQIVPAAIAPAGLEYVPLGIKPIN